MTTWMDALAKTRRNITGALSRVFAKDGAVGEALLEELEETMLASDIPVRVVSEICMELEEEHAGHREALREILVSRLGAQKPFIWCHDEAPCTILIVGVNGSGKTTTCAKLAHHIIEDGKVPLLAAADTFRAAGADQLKLWAQTVGSDVVAGATGGDAAAVAYDALEAAMVRNADYLVIDTAGRMHTKKPLMQELGKIKRSLEKKRDAAPDEVWIVLDASLGQNAVVQARTFNEMIPLTGVIVTKLDGSSRAGFVYSIAAELGIPIRFVGLGESREDLVPFDPEAFVDAMLAPGTGEQGEKI